MNIDEIEAEVLKLAPQVRARLARKLLESLEALSDEENERLWAEEADWRDADWDSTPGSARPAAERELNEAAQYYDGEEPGLGSSSFRRSTGACSPSGPIRKPESSSVVLFVAGSSADFPTPFCTRSGRAASESSQ